MMDTAEYFDFTPESTEVTEKKIREILSRLVKGADSPKRVKLTMNLRGELSGEVKDFQPGKKVFRVCLAKQPVDSNDRFLLHKTTQRGVYEQALVEGYDDVLLYNEKDELTEFTIGSLVVELDGELFTPPIACGLLAGTFRAELLESGEIKERVIRKDELPKCSKLFLINSVRKWVEAALPGAAPIFEAKKR
jgi:para-aminobenzoate synthetase/4-amino-4-deoxychorismate lyase